MKPLTADMHSFTLHSFSMLSAYLTLVSGMPMAAGCEGSLLPEAAGCGPFLCERLPDVSVFVRLGSNRLCGALTTPHQSSSAATVSRRAPLPSQKLLFPLLGE